MFTIVKVDAISKSDKRARVATLSPQLPFLFFFFQQQKRADATQLSYVKFSVYIFTSLSSLKDYHRNAKIHVYLTTRAR